ncbi:MAG TPA: MBL fold metallo-hydrolase, partial [Planctomycetota bacterium]|nr:MBL fold metallo-hydrolase [Planctomycetota bacterium]
AIATSLRDPHVLLLEFNHCRDMLLKGPYPEALKRRVGGGQGHLNNDQAATMLEWLVGPNTHTLVLAHLSAHNNEPERALDAARGTLARLGLDSVRVVVAQQDQSLEAIEV